MNKLLRYLLSLSLVLLPTFSLNSTPLPKTAVNAVQGEEPQISENAKRQIESLLQEKMSRTSEQQKIDPQLLYLYKQQSGGNVTEEVRTLTTNVQIDERRRVLVDVRGKGSEEVLQKLARLRSEVLFTSATDQTIRARVPLNALEEVATSADVQFIEAALEPLNNVAKPPVSSEARAASPFAFSAARKNLASGLGSSARRDAARAKVAAALAKLNATKISRRAGDGAEAIVTGPPFSQGDAAHRANILREVFGFDGTGVRIGVLSDTVRYLEQSQASKNLPLDVTVLPGQSGMTSTFLGIGEGTAMLEIIHDLAPGAKLFYATAFNGDASFAQNIRSLRFTYGCDIIVDDVFYINESPFQDGIIARAVNDVTADGALYFSAVGNMGNLNDGTGGVWEGDWLDGGTLTSLPDAAFYRIHSFGERVISNRIRSIGGNVIKLHWSDPLNASTNDYDLFVLDATLSRVKAASTGFQTGTQAPFEILSTSGLVAGDRIVIAQFGNAQPRALHLNTVRGQLALATDGQTHGHASAAEAFAVAAVPASAAQNGVFSGGYFNPVETSTSDGPRRVFFTPTGAPLTPDNFLFATNGGTVRQKPDLAAADGVSTSVPGFTTFFGTSAAASHAAAIAALAKSFAPSLTKQQLRELLISTALDIGTLGWDRSAGIGLVMALESYLAFSPSPLLEYRAVELIAAEGDGDAFVEPGEVGRLDIAFFNAGNTPALGVKAKITALTPGVTVLAGESDYFQIAEGKAAVNLSPFRFRLAETVACGARVNFAVTVSASNSPARSFSFSVQTGQPGTPQAMTYTGAPVSIPDGNLAGVTIRVPVSGLINTIRKVSFRINGDNCATPTGVGLQHTWVGDLTLRLISPSGTAVVLMSAPGGINNFGQHFCNTLLDDAGNTSIQNIVPAGAPYTGTFRPATPLAVFHGENPNGNWTLQLIDSATPDPGIMRSFSILITTYDCQRAASVQEIRVNTNRGGAQSRRTTSSRARQ